MAESEPQHYGNFILQERVAVGGMAEIFRAKKLGAEGFEKELVIKRILPHFSEDESFVTMFKDEARIAANLNHANIVQIYEFDECDGTFYIAMEFIDGKDLKRIMDAGAKRNKPLLVGESVYIIAQVADGLHYAHTRTYNGQPLNIVHRDVSPHNIMMSIDGDVKLMDFGIAKAAARSTKTQAGTVKGKCAYMSPEQARGKDLDGRSDLFALGVCLWEMLTGQRLFVGETEFETLSKVLKADIPPASQLNPDVHPKLEKILGQALARDRDMRFKDLGAFKQALMSFFYQHCEPDLIDLGAYMRWLYKKGPMPRSRESAMVPPPTVAAPVYRGGAAAEAPSKAQEEPVEAPAPAERTAVMPASTDPPASAQPEPPAQNPTVPMPPYRPQDHEPGNVGAPARGSRKTGQTAARSEVDDSPVEVSKVKGKTASLTTDDVQARLKTRDPVPSRSAEKGKGKKGGLPIVPILIGVAIFVLLAGVGGFFAYRASLDDSPGKTPEAGSGEGSGATEATGKAGGTSGSGAAAAPVGELVRFEVTSDPKGAEVFVDSKETGLVTPTSYRARAGTTIKIKVKKIGYRPSTREVEVTEGLAPVDFKLEKRK